MNHFYFSKYVSRGWLLITILLISSSSLDAAPTNTVATTKVVEPPGPRLSVFDDKLKTSKDPFFPSSTRRAPRVDAGQKIAAVDTAKDLVLRGITGGKGRKLALINNQTFSEGEQAFVKIPSGQVKVRCVEIRDQSVVINVEGTADSKEIRLKDF